MKRFGLYGAQSRDLLTVGGRVLVHSSPDAGQAKAELEFLFPGSHVREVPPSIPADQTLPLEQHPELADVLTFPLTKEQFRRG